MTPIWHECIFICLIYAILSFTRTSVLGILDLIFIFVCKYQSRHASNVECIIFEDIQNSQPHISLYRADNFFGRGGNSERNVESLIMILLSTFLDSFSPPSFVALKILLWSSLIDTCNKNVGKVAFQCNYQFSLSDNHW